MAVNARSIGRNIAFALASFATGFVLIMSAVIVAFGLVRFTIWITHLLGGWGLAVCIAAYLSAGLTIAVFREEGWR